MLMPIIVPPDFLALCIDQINEGQGLTGIILEQFSLAAFYYSQLSTNYKQGTTDFLNNDYLWEKKKTCLSGCLKECAPGSALAIIYRLL